MLFYFHAGPLMAIVIFLFHVVKAKPNAEKNVGDFFLDQYLSLSNTFEINKASLTYSLHKCSHLYITLKLLCLIQLSLFLCGTQVGFGIIRII